VNLKSSKKNAKKYSQTGQKGRPARIPITQCIGYIRVSSEEQADSGLSLEAQRLRVQQFAELSGWQLVHTFEDAGVSAKNLERPALQEALKELRPGRILLALKIDRLTRCVPDLYELDALVSDQGAEWATVTEKIDTSTATGRMLRTFIALIAEWERGIIAERTVAALGEKKRRRERLGTTPLGYKTIEGADGLKLVVEDADEMETVRLIREWHNEGKGLGLREIARRLTAEGHKTKRGGAWEPITVSRLLKKRYLEEIKNGAL
jgi:DNA invertase Pin-like site-specific DNA recombinase